MLSMAYHVILPWPGGVVRYGRMEAVHLNSNRFQSVVWCRAGLCMLVVALVTAGVVRAQASLPARDVLSAGDGSELWVGQVVTEDAKEPAGTSTTKTELIGRPQGGGEDWVALTSIPTRLTSLTLVGEDLAGVEEGGQWLLISDSGPRSGLPLPGRGRMVMVAGAGDVNNTLWAVGGVPGGAREARLDLGRTSALARPSTNPSVEAEPTRSSLTIETPSVAEPYLVLFSLEEGRWRLRAQLPDALAQSDPRRLSLGFDGQTLRLAGMTGARDVLLFSFNATDDAWGESTVLTTPFDVHDLKLFQTSPGRTSLWTTGETGAGVVFTDLSGAEAPFDLNRAPDPTTSTTQSAAKTDGPIPDASAATSRTITSALGRVRLVYRDGEKLYERRYDVRDLSPVGAAVPIEQPAPTTSPTSPVEQYVSLLVLAVLVFVMLSVLRNRGGAQEEAMREAQKRLKPARRLFRLLAGLVDALPIVAVNLYVWYLVKDKPEMMEAAGAYKNWMYLAAGVSLLHTTLAEVFFGRSIGKMLLGLYVVNLAGQKPTTGKLVLRNIVRVVEIELIFPLLLILFTPLSQRMGDLASGTVVVEVPPGTNVKKDEEKVADDTKRDV